MNVTFELPAFTEAARAIKPLPGGAAGAAGIAIYNHAWMKAASGKLTLAMSNLDQEARADIDCGGGDVAALLPMAVLEFCLARTGEGEASLEFDEDLQRVVARHGKARLTMPILRAEDFYLMDLRPGDQWSLSVRAAELARDLERVQLAASTIAAQPHMQGVFLHRSDDAMMLAATDGGRIHAAALGDATLDGALPQANADDPPGVILPNRMIKEFVRLFGDDQSEVTLRGTRNMVVVEGARLRLASKLVEGVFPPWNKVVPQRPDASIGVDAAALGKAISAVLVEDRTDAKGKRVAGRKIKLTVGDEMLTVEAKGDTGNAEDSIAIDNQGVEQGVWMQFNADFLRDAFEAAGNGRQRLYPPPQIGMPVHVAAESGNEGVIVVGQQGGYL